LTVGVIAGSGGAGRLDVRVRAGPDGGRVGSGRRHRRRPAGPGVDRVLGLDGYDGIRWDALCQTTGRFSGRSLRESLPRRDGLGVLTWYPGPQGPLQAFAVRKRIAAAQRGHETVVVDLPRSVDPLVEELVARCDQVFVLTVPTVAGLASAVRLCARFRTPTRCGWCCAATGSAPMPVPADHRAGGRADARPARARGGDRPRARAGALAPWPARPDARSLVAAPPRRDPLRRAA
jgi:hypothetical protein